MNENIYASFEPASCLPDCWCEMPRYGQMILEPGNFWSNLAYIFCAIIISIFYKNIPHKKLTSLCFIAIGIGSMAFHGTGTFIGQTLDVFCMYLLVNLFIFQIWETNFRYRYYFLTNIVLLSLLIFVPEFRRAGFFILVIALLFISFKKLKWNKYLGLSIFLMVAAQVIWNLDRLKIICEPNKFITGHFLWHIFSALSALSFVHYLKVVGKIKRENNFMRN